MSSILRAPQLSIEKRKLPAQRPAAPQPQQAAAAITAAPVANEQATMQTHIKREVERLLLESRAAILAEATKDIAAARQTARQEGLREGRVQGEAAGRKSAEDATARLGAATGALESALARGIGGAEDVMVEIVFETVCKIVGDLAPGTDGIRALVRRAAAHTTGNRPLMVRLHPADLAVLREAGGTEDVLLSEPALCWVADEGIALGGCILETDRGELDARLETQLDRLRAALIGARAAGV